MAASQNNPPEKDMKIALHWFKSNGDFAEWVDFDNWQSGIGKQACFVKL